MKKIIFICLFPFFAYGQNIKPAINLDGEWVAYPYGKDNKYDFYDPYIKYQFKADSFNCSNSMGIGNKNFVSRGVFFLQNNKIVFKTSSECKFGKTLKKVPPAVPIRVWLLLVIFAWRQNRFPCGQLAYRRDNTASNS